MRAQIQWISILIFTASLAGCTVHPAGESAQRAAARDAGQTLQSAAENAPPTTLPANPTVDDLVRCALENNAEVNQKYWEWRAAIEQIPISGTPGTTLAINAATGMNRGQASLDRTVLTAQNMPSMMIPWPAKLSTAARAALANAQAAEQRFHQAQFAVRAKVLIAWDQYALNAEMIRLEQSDARILQSMKSSIEASAVAGTNHQQDFLQASNQLELLQNNIAQRQARLAPDRANINALLNRRPSDDLPLPKSLPASMPLLQSDAELIALAEGQNPQLAAISHQADARAQDIILAKLQYYPDFAAGVSSDLAGISQSLSGMVSVPLLRHEAIDAAIRQAQDNLLAVRLLHRQSENDLSAAIVSDIQTIRDADRQLILLRQNILPRARQIVALARSAFEAGQSPLHDLLADEQSLVSLEQLVATQATARAQALADLESITATDLSVKPAARSMD